MGCGVVVVFFVFVNGVGFGGVMLCVLNLCVVCAFMFFLLYMLLCLGVVLFRFVGFLGV